VKKKVAPVVFRALLGLYVDMPKVDMPSINAEILYEIAGGEALALLCFHYAPLYEDGNHIETLFCHFKWLGKYANTESRCQPTRLKEEHLRLRRNEIADRQRGIKAEQPSVSLDPVTCGHPSDKTAWHSVVVSAYETCTFEPATQ
jgi:hypothetical protein